MIRLYLVDSETSDVANSTIVFLLDVIDNVILL